MTSETNTPVHHQTRAQRYGIAHYPKLVQDMMLFLIGLKEDGIRETFRSARTIVLLRTHMKLFDLPFMRKMQQPLYGERALQGMTLTATSTEEAQGGTHCSPMPSKVLEWALQELQINPADFHFVDVGSGWGYNMLQAAQHGFISVSGVEYAQELHDAAAINTQGAETSGLIKAGSVLPQHMSALDMTFPEGHKVLCLFHPFNASVMQQFMQHLVQSERGKQNNVFLIYVNTVEYEALESGGYVTPVPVSLSGKLKNILLNPFSVKLYRLKKM